jgi:enoyl-[acyl-carrier protein] reductase/trans-2-enoyl-CoA reductase (NAD+)
MSAQVVKPRIRGFIATNAHPDGCAANVRAQVEVAQASLPGTGIDNVLVIGSSTGYGLSSAICGCFGYGASTLGVCFERPSTEDKGASAGWYNVAEAHRLAREQGRSFETINGDAFSEEIKQQAVDALKARFGKIDLLVYSLAAPRRQGADGTVWNSVLKPIGSSHSAKTINLRSGAIEERTFDQATDQEIADTLMVMGGEDWADWVETLRDNDLLADSFRTVAYSYIGPQATQAIYRFGTIGHAKEHLEATAQTLNERLSADLRGGAWVSVNKAVVTQASAAIPGVPLYIGILFKVMKERGLHEGTIEQIVRLYRDHLISDGVPATDDGGRIRLDDLEMTPEVQATVDGIWNEVTTERVGELLDYEGYQRDFRQIFGFDVNGIDYDAPTEVHRELS